MKRGGSAAAGGEGPMRPRRLPVDEADITKESLVYA